MNPLEVLRAVDFDWAMRLSEVWNDSAWDVPGLHAGLREEFVGKLRGMGKQPQAGSPLGWVMVGAGGAGKTHLLGVFHREAVRRQAAFVLVDMTDVRDFWETVLQGYLDSLQVHYEDDLYQYQCLLRNLIQQMKPNRPVAEVVAILARDKSSNLVKDITKVLKALTWMSRKEALRFQNVVRALVCLNSDDFAISSLGLGWLHGQQIDAAAGQALGFTTSEEEPLKIVEALSWLMGLCGPTILAFDQLDPIVTQLNYQRRGEMSSEEQGTAKSIIAAIGGGLGALRDMTRNTLTVVACLESTWDVLREVVLRPSLDRFEPSRSLSAVQTSTVAEAVVRNRLALAFAQTGFTPPYPTWPFLPEAFAELTSNTPREVLKKCALHRQLCLRNGAIHELKSFKEEIPGPGKPPPQDFQALDRHCAELKAQADLPYLLAEKHEDERLAPLLQTALQCLIHEHDLPQSVDAVVDSQFPGGKTTRPLHARLRLIFPDEEGREEHFCVRALELTNATAYQTRLKAAMTQSGIDRALKFRRLTVVRSGPPPEGKVTQQLTEKLLNAGGILYQPKEDELRLLHALYHLKQEGQPDFEKWLHERRPLSRLSLIRTAVPSPFFAEDGAARETNSPGAEALGGGEAKPQASSPKIDKHPPEMASAPLSQSPPLAELPLGKRLVAGKAGDPVTMPVALLEKHTLILAGAGSGKTVLLRRLVEEAALLGIPSIVIDAANDLATLDEQWTVRPADWQPEDDQKAERYHRQTEVVIWTPGKESGNPLALEPLPDLAAVSTDSEELEDAVAMVRESLGPIVAPGNTQTAQNKQGVLSGALRFFARQGGGRLPEFIALLDDLPPEAGLGVANEAKLASQVADTLKVAMETNPLLRSSGPPLDPAILFGADRSAGRTRISVINFIGLPGLEAQRHFLNQLAMTLFSWIKKNPAPGGKPLRGLLVIDEAKDFVPSQKASVCKESLMRLTAQARKYHLGLVFATQNPKDIENKIIANCSTHYYGKVNSPAAIDAIRDQIRLKGGSGDDVPRLPRGQFYVHNADAALATPVKVAISLCLSRHPENPLEETRILEKALASRLSC